MRMVNATTSGSYRVDQGSHEVLVGIMDTGIDGSHPDLAANFNRRLSRNFTTDIPLVDGPCEHPSCVDPADEDDDGHGTHVAGLVGAALNGPGTAGVAPRITLVNIRAVLRAALADGRDARERAERTLDLAVHRNAFRAQ